MTKPVRPISPVERRAAERRTADRRASGRALVPMPPETAQAEPAPSNAVSASGSPPSPTAFAAQILGQEGQKRGLRGGKEVLDQARSTYLSAEYSGPADRRPPKGKAVKSEL